MLYDTDLKTLPKTSPRTISRLTASGITSIGDLLDIIPFRYEDYSLIIPIKDIAAHYSRELEEEVTQNIVSVGKVTIQGTLVKKTNIFARRGFSMQKVTISDDSGETTVTWFNQPYLLSALQEGIHMAISGSVKNNNGNILLQPENYEVMHDGLELMHTGRIVPIYSSIPGVSIRTLREKVFLAVKLYADMVSEYIPIEILQQTGLPSMREVISDVHFPNEIKDLKKMRERISFNELFSIQLKTTLVRKAWEDQKIDHSMKSSKRVGVDSFVKSLPYTLTNAQSKAIDEILKDMSTTRPMNRLLQGDVGSGKTIVAVAASLYAFFNDKKVLYMAPTEILAQQQYEGLMNLFLLLDEAKRPSIKLVTTHSKVSDDEFKNAHILIGTHALISSKRTFSDVGLVIIDEQHKFGVMQRAALKKKGMNPHMLSLTATPIPRTVLLSLYGELDVSTIDEFPKGRKEIKTYVTPEQKRSDAYIWIKEELKLHHQVFVVCPFIEQSEKETLQSVKAATQEIDTIKKEFSAHSVELLHGKLKSDEKERIMGDFASGKLDILVATPVVEVGIDVPNATIIIIEGAERFGLAQLHQLRGRVGRSDLQSYCLLFTSNSSEAIAQRLRMFSTTHDGFALAQYDLAHRGGGNIFGTQQHGYSPIALETLMNPQMIQNVQEACRLFISSEFSYLEYPFLVKRLEAFNFESIAQN